MIRRAERKRWFVLLTAIVVLAMVVMGCSSGSGGSSGGDSGGSSSDGRQTGKTNDGATGNTDNSASSDANQKEETAYPEKDIRVVVPYNPGGGTDTFARAIEPFLSEKLGVSIVIDNRPGAGGVAGHSEVFAADADGYTLAIWSSPSNEANVNQEGVPYKITDFTALGSFYVQPSHLIARKGAPWNNVEEFIADVQANPRKYSMGTIGMTASAVIGWGQAIRDLGLDFKFIPFDSTAEVEQAILGGHVDVMVGGMGGNAIQLHKDGEVKILAFATVDRLPSYEDLPDVPTFYEAMDFKVESGARGAIAIRSTAPQEIIDKLRAVIDEIAEDEAFLKELKSRMPGNEISYIDGETFTEKMRENAAMTKELTPWLESLTER